MGSGGSRVPYSGLTTEPLCVRVCKARHAAECRKRFSFLGDRQQGQAKAGDSPCCLTLFFVETLGTLPLVPTLPSAL